MLKHIRANVWLLVLTVLLCSVIYPLLLLGVAQLPPLREQAEGSLIYDRAGNLVGSRLIAINKGFEGDEYFQPRPSAVSYNAAASGASNYAASNPLLRDRVARSLGPIVKYRKGRAPRGKTVQEDVTEWFAANANVVADWADKYPSSAQAWANADDKHKKAITDWQEKHPKAVGDWKQGNPGKEPAPADLAQPFFKDNATAFHKAWPKLIDDDTWSVPAVFFDMYLQAHPEVDRDHLLEDVPADLVMASGSGLDPHITLKNARYQLGRVAGKWAEKTHQKKEQVRAEIETLLDRRAEAPLGGLVGVKLVNVLEVNLALRERYEEATVQATR
jgi:K+-transporting ATPase ATPase C chain